MLSAGCIHCILRFRGRLWKQEFFLKEVNQFFSRAEDEAGTYGLMRANFDKVLKLHSKFHEESYEENSFYEKLITFIHFPSLNEKFSSIW